eukprot:scpid65480/ scgid12100/ Serine/threonine-protein kinase SBK2; SH3-binding domain kinase family member 2; Sugen kinase 69
MLHPPAKRAKVDSESKTELALGSAPGLSESPPSLIPSRRLVLQPREDFATAQAQALHKKVYEETTMPPVVSVQKYSECWTLDKAMRFSNQTKVGIDLATSNQDGKKYILKFASYEATSAEPFDKVRMSELVREMLVNKFVLEKIGCQYFARVEPAAFVLPCGLYMQMEYCQYQDLRELSDTDMSATERLRLISEAARGLDQLHTLGLVHFDVKLTNIGVSQDASGRKRAKLIDLGSTKVVGAQARPDDVLSGDTSTYRCPELWVLRKHPLLPESQEYSVGPEVDMWALGFSMVRLLFNAYNGPWAHANAEDPDYSKFITTNRVGPDAVGRIERPPWLEFTHHQFQKGISRFVNFLAYNLLRVDRHSRMSAKTVADEIDKHLGNGGQ